MYTDDGHTFDFRNGAFARIHFSCSLAEDGSLTITIGKQEGSWKPWWTQYRVEVVDWTPKEKHGRIDGSTEALHQGGWKVGPYDSGEPRRSRDRFTLRH